MAKRRASADRIDDVIAVALALFLERGYDNTPMSLVAKRLRLTKAGIYHHFESKEDLLFLAHQRTMERQLVPILALAEAESDPERRLRIFISSYARMLALEPTAGLLIREARRLSPKHLVDIKKTWRRGLALLKDAVSELQRQGRCREDISPTYAAFAAIGMTNWISFWFDPERLQSADDVAAAMEALFMDGLRVGGPGTGPAAKGRSAKGRGRRPNEGEAGIARRSR
jgi:AcrR family transcriptional regulator